MSEVPLLTRTSLPVNLEELHNLLEIVTEAKDRTSSRRLYQIATDLLTSIQYTMLESGYSPEEIADAVKQHRGKTNT